MAKLGAVVENGRKVAGESIRRQVESFQVWEIACIGRNRCGDDLVLETYPGDVSGEAGNLRPVARGRCGVP